MRREHVVKRRKQADQREPSNLSIILPMAKTTTIAAEGAMLASRNSDISQEPLFFLILGRGGANDDPPLGQGAHDHSLLFAVFWILLHHGNLGFELALTPGKVSNKEKCPVTDSLSLQAPGRTQPSTRASLAAPFLAPSSRHSSRYPMCETMSRDGDDGPPTTR